MVYHCFTTFIDWNIYKQSSCDDPIKQNISAVSSKNNIPFSCMPSHPSYPDIKWVIPYGRITSYPLSRYEMGHPLWQNNLLHLSIYEMGHHLCQNNLLSLPKYEMGHPLWQNNLLPLLHEMGHLLWKNNLLPSSRYEIGHPLWQNKVLSLPRYDKGCS